MSKNLIIVESPAKAKTMAKYLGKGFTALASYGHVRDLQIAKDRYLRQCSANFLGVLAILLQVQALDRNLDGRGRAKAHHLRHDVSGFERDRHFWYGPVQARP